MGKVGYGRRRAVLLSHGIYLLEVEEWDGRARRIHLQRLDHGLPLLSLQLDHDYASIMLDPGLTVYVDADDALDALERFVRDAIVIWAEGWEEASPEGGARPTGGAAHRLKRRRG